MCKYVLMMVNQHDTIHQDTVSLMLQNLHETILKCSALLPVVDLLLPKPRLRPQSLWPGISRHETVSNGKTSGRF